MKKITYVLLIVLLFTFITGCSNNKNEDAIKFKDEYESINGKKSKSGKENRKVNIPDDNPFIYITAEDLSKKIDEKETFIVYFGFNSCPWCRSIIEELINCAKDSEVEKIYYVDVLDIRDKKEIDEDGNIKTITDGTKGYTSLLEQLDEVLDVYTITNSTGEKIEIEEKRIYAPNVIAVVDGKATKMETGISEDLTDPYMELTDKIKKETYEKFKCIFKCLEEKETLCTTKMC